MLKRLLALLLALALMIPATAALAATPTRTLVQGMSGEDVKDAQTRLKYYGYYSGTEDGYFSSAMVEPVKEFQTANGLVATGNISVTMQTLLNSSTAIPKKIEKPEPEKPDPSIVISTTQTLEYGMKGTEVLAAQKRLAGYGYYTGPLDSNYGSVMRAAVIQFQRKNGLVADGKIGPKTRSVLNSETAVGASETDIGKSLSIGMNGEEVKELQRQLRQTYYYAGTIDGIFGSAVLRAVKAFQASTGMYVDGKAGSKTQDALYNRTADIFNGGIPVRSLSSGDRGYDVYVLQKKLASLNYYNETPNGVYDTDTVAAVKAFQKANTLTVDGKFGSVVRRYLWPSTVTSQEEEENYYTGTPDDPYAERTIRLGSYGNDVARAQMRLKSAGYLLGNADGIFGKNTKAAVIKLQKDYNLKQDGIVGSKTWAIINTLSVSNAEQTVVEDNKPSVGANVTKLRRGSSGSAVKKLQQQLISLGYLPSGEDDGKYGPKTAMAVMMFQKDQKISVDGVAGTQTFVKLNEVLGVQWDVPVG